MSSGPAAAGSSSGELSILVSLDGEIFPLLVDLGESVNSFKSKVLAATGIPVENQRFQGLNLHIYNPRAKLSLLNLKSGQTIFLNKGKPPHLEEKAENPKKAELTMDILAGALKALPVFRQLQAAGIGGNSPVSSAPPVNSSRPPPEAGDLQACCSRSFFGTEEIQQPGAIVQGRSVCFACAQTCFPPGQAGPRLSNEKFFCSCAASSDCLFAARSLIAADSIPQPYREQYIQHFSTAASQQFQALAGRNIQQFQSKILSQLKLVAEYENFDWQKAARAVIPLEMLENRAAVAMEESRQKHVADPDNYPPPFSPRDELFRQLLAWWKHEFFKWVNNPPCEKCGNTGTTAMGGTQPSAAEALYRAGIVELYRCPGCSAITRFPRYNDPKKLLETRRGRCGEFANCFALCCRSLGYETRIILDWTDHIWVEIYSPGRQRWIHADPCENSSDSPLMYENGWGKSLSYIIAFSIEECLDVSRRYSHQYEKLLKSRQSVPESWLIGYLIEINRNLQRNLHQERKLELLKRWENVEKMELERNQYWDEEKEKKNEAAASALKAEEQQGRITGSVEWRAARGELGDAQRTAAAEERQKKLGEALKAKDAGLPPGAVCDPETGMCTIPSIQTPQKQPAASAPASSSSPAPATGSPASLEAEKARVRHLFQSYHRQFTQGCGNSSCQNSLCRSSPAFEFSSTSSSSAELSPSDIAKRCLEWTMKYKSSRICSKKE